MDPTTQLSPTEQAQQIWDQLDREDNGTAAPPPPLEPQRPEQQASEPAAAAPAEHHDANVPADATQQPPASPEAQAFLDRIAGLESMLQQQNTLIQQQDKRLRQAEGKVGELNAQLRTQIQAAQQVNARGGDAPSAQQIEAAQKSPEALAQLKEDYPEFGAAVEKVLNEHISRVEQRVPQQPMPQADANGQQPVTREELEQMKREQQERLIDSQISARHPEWKNTVVNPAFRGWLGRQPVEVQLLAASDSPQAAIRLLDIYQGAHASGAQRNQRLSAAAALPSGRQVGGHRSKPIEEMTPQEYWAYLDEQEKAQAKGT